MSEFDLDSLLEPVSATDPTGKDPEYDPDFTQLKEAASGQPERVMGDTVVPAVPPDWKQVLALGTDLLSRSKDIRTAILVCRALLHCEGFSGLASGITLIRRLLAEYWESVHPQLDTDDDNDPTERMNALLDLCDRDVLLTPVRTTPLVHSRTFGPVSLRDIEVAKGESSEPAAGKQAPLDAASVDAAFQDCELEQLRETAGAVASAVSDLGELERIVTDQVGVAQVPDLRPIRDLFAEADTLLRTKLAERTGTSDAELEATVSTGNGVPTEATLPPGDKPATSGGGNRSATIAGREDVVRMLDRICDYYARNEPSSPVPLLLQRARRLVTKDFVGIVQDLAPEGLAQIEAIRGPEGDD
ncbi:type VI secretion system protein TssA [Candidatus Thiosymbion oneisti]|uniref:type VI secretion system protein TssA n=1 Tax=Candidatus Thiosymbion oneisti TaxID=589554 RepID=UPI000AC46F96|nr:type VI secretion system protein TssA [Candidatus Thiosymbion oneisti]